MLESNQNPKGVSNTAADKAYLNTANRQLLDIFKDEKISEKYEMIGKCLSPFTLCRPGYWTALG
jgi:hypothetical protein